MLVRLLADFIVVRIKVLVVVFHEDWALLEGTFFYFVWCVFVVFVVVGGVFVVVVGCCWIFFRGEGGRGV